MKRQFLSIVTLASSLYFVAGARGQENVVNMESTVQGNQEQPKVLYIVPWKAPEGPKSLYQTLDSQMRTVFSHVDRAEFRRELHYLEQLSNSEGNHEIKE